MTRARPPGPSEGPSADTTSNSQAKPDSMQKGHEHNSSGQVKTKLKPGQQDIRQYATTQSTQPSVNATAEQNSMLDTESTEPAINASKQTSIKSPAIPNVRTRHAAAAEAKMDAELVAALTFSPRKASLRTSSVSAATTGVDASPQGLKTTTPVSEKKQRKTKTQQLTTRTSKTETAAQDDQAQQTPAAAVVAAETGEKAVDAADVLPKLQDESQAAPADNKQPDTAGDGAEPSKAVDPVTENQEQQPPKKKRGRPPKKPATLPDQSQGGKQGAQTAASSQDAAGTTADIASTAVAVTVKEEPEKPAVTKVGRAGKVTRAAQKSKASNQPHEQGAVAAADQPDKATSAADVAEGSNDGLAAPAPHSNATAAGEKTLEQADNHAVTPAAEMDGNQDEHGSKEAPSSNPQAPDDVAPPSTNATTDAARTDTAVDNNTSDTEQPPAKKQKVSGGSKQGKAITKIAKKEQPASVPGASNADAKARNTTRRSKQADKSSNSKPSNQVKTSEKPAVEPAKDAANITSPTSPASASKAITKVASKPVKVTKLAKTPVQLAKPKAKQVALIGPPAIKQEPQESVSIGKGVAAARSDSKKRPSSDNKSVANTPEKPANLPPLSTTTKVKLKLTPAKATPAVESQDKKAAAVPEDNTASQAAMDTATPQEQAGNTSAVGVRHSTRRHVRPAKLADMEDLSGPEVDDNDLLVPYEPALPRKTASSTGKTMVNGIKAAISKRATGASTPAAAETAVVESDEGDVQPPSKKQCKPGPKVGSKIAAVVPAAAAADKTKLAGKKRKGPDTDSTAQGGTTGTTATPKPKRAYKVKEAIVYISPEQPVEEKPATVIGEDDVSYTNPSWNKLLKAPPKLDNKQSKPSSKVDKASVSSPKLDKVSKADSKADNTSKAAPKTDELLEAPSRDDQQPIIAPPPPPLALPQPPPAANPDQLVGSSIANAKFRVFMKSSGPPKKILNGKPLGLPEINGISSTLNQQQALAPQPPPPRSSIRRSERSHVKAEGIPSGIPTGPASQPPQPPIANGPPQPPLPPSMIPTAPGSGQPAPGASFAFQPPQSQLTPETMARTPHHSRIPAITSSAVSQQKSWPGFSASIKPVYRPDILPEVTVAVAAAFNAVLSNEAMESVQATTPAPPSAQSQQASDVHFTVQPINRSVPTTPSDMTDPRLQLAQRAREALNYNIPASFNSKVMLSTGLFEGMEVEYRKRAGDARIVGNRGWINNALVRCNCRQCKGQQIVNLATFEQHAGSAYKKPSDYVYFSALDINLKECMQLISGEPMKSKFIGTLYLPWPEGYGSRPNVINPAPFSPAATPGAHAGSMPMPGQRSQRASASMALFNMRASAGLPVTGEDEDSKNKKAKKLAAAPPARAAGMYPGLLPPLHVIPRTSVPPAGPTMPDLVPETFSVGYWKQKVVGGEMRISTTAKGAYLAAAATGPEPAPGAEILEQLNDTSNQENGPVQPTTSATVGNQQTAMEVEAQNTAQPSNSMSVMNTQKDAGAAQADLTSAQQDTSSRQQNPKMQTDTGPESSQQTQPTSYSTDQQAVASLPVSPVQTKTKSKQKQSGNKAAGVPPRPASDQPLALVDNVWAPLPEGVPPPPAGMIARVFTTRNSKRHQRLFDPAEGVLKQGQHIQYMMHGQVIIEGTVDLDALVKHKHGLCILCHHCNTLVSPSGFEGHAGYRERRNPYNHITTDDGLTFRDLAAQLPPLPEDVSYSYVTEESLYCDSPTTPADTKKDSSVSNRMVRNLLMRRMPAFKPGSGHNRGSTTPFGGRATRPATDTDMSGGSPAAGAGQQDGEPEGPQLSALTSSCVICFDAGFDREGFSDRTVLICDQCEREFHVGCLRRTGHNHLQKLPEGNWFCSDDCGICHAALSAQVEAGEMVVSDDGHTLHVMKGRDGSLATARNLHIVLEMLQESFDPIVSSGDGMDLLPSMVLSVQHGDFDFQGMYSLLLKHRGRPVCAGLFRVFGDSLAELPLIATKLSARRQGHCKVLMSILEERLKLLSVRLLALPAAHDAVITWVRGFKFRYMHPVQIQCALAELRLLIFPGTQVLYKDLTGGEGEYRGIGGGPSSLMSAHPTGLPPEIQAYIDQTARHIADDAIEQGLPLEPWMPVPNADPGTPATPAQTVDTELTTSLQQTSATFTGQQTSQLPTASVNAKPQPILHMLGSEAVSGSVSTQLPDQATRNSLGRAAEVASLPPFPVLSLETSQQPEVTTLLPGFQLAQPISLQTDSSLHQAPQQDVATASEQPTIVLQMRPSEGGQQMELGGSNTHMDVDLPASLDLSAPSSSQQPLQAAHTQVAEAAQQLEQTTTVPTVQDAVPGSYGADVPMQDAVEGHQENVSMQNAVDSNQEDVTMQDAVAGPHKENISMQDMTTPPVEEAQVSMQVDHPEQPQQQLEVLQSPVRGLLACPEQPTAEEATTEQQQQLQHQQQVQGVSTVETAVVKATADATCLAPTEHAATEQQESQQATGSLTVETTQNSNPFQQPQDLQQAAAVELQQPTITQADQASELQPVLPDAQQNAAQAGPVTSIQVVEPVQTQAATQAAQEHPQQQSAPPPVNDTQPLQTEQQQQQHLPDQLHTEQLPGPPTFDSFLLDNLPEPPTALPIDFNSTINSPAGILAGIVPETPNASPIPGTEDEGSDIDPTMDFLA